MTVRIRSGSQLVGAAGEIVWWWAFTDAVWLASVTSISDSEMAVATVTTLPCGILAWLARRANRGRWRFRIGWLLPWTAIVARDIVVQTVQAWMYALVPRRRHAVFTVVPLPAEDEQTAAGRRAVSTLSLATTPGTVVCDSSSRLGRLLVHRLGEKQGRLEWLVER